MNHDFAPNPEESREAARASFVAELREHPEWLEILDGVPPLGSDTPTSLSFKDVVTKYFGINEPPQSAPDLSSQLGIDKDTAWNLCWQAAEVIRLTFDTSVTVPLVSPSKERHTSTLAKRVREYQEIRQLFERKDMDPHLRAFMQVPIFNSKNIPESVLQAATDIANTGSTQQPLLTVEYFLRLTYGIGTDSRASQDTLAALGGFSHEVSSAYKGAIYSYLNKHYGTHFPKFKASIIQSTEKRLTTQHQIIAALNQVDKSHGWPRPFTTVSDIIVDLTALGLGEGDIAQILNRRLLCVTIYNSPPIKTGYVQRKSSEFRNINSHQFTSDYDRAEAAAVLLQQTAHATPTNQRTALVVEILYLKAQGYTKAEIAEELNLEYEGLSSTLMGDALREIPGIDWEAITKIGRKTLARLTPLYLQHRRQLGDDPQTNQFTAFSDREMYILRQVAGCIDQSAIAKNLSTLRNRLWTTVDALLNPNFGSRPGLHARRAELIAGIEVLQQLDQDKAWEPYYQDVSQLHQDIQLIQTMQASQFSRPIMEEQGYSRSHIAQRLNKIRTVLRSRAQSQLPIPKLTGK